MTDKRKRKLPLLVTAFIMVVIFTQSALPADLSKRESNAILLILMKFFSVDAESMSFVIRKCAHFTEYLMLGISLFATMREYWPDKKGAGFVLPWGIGTLYAVTDEIHQYFVPGRSCELRDVLIDSCGVAAGVLIISLIVRARRRT